MGGGGRAGQRPRRYFKLGIADIADRSRDGLAIFLLVPRLPFDEHRRRIGLELRVDFHMMGRAEKQQVRGLVPLFFGQSRLAARTVFADCENMGDLPDDRRRRGVRSEEHTSELQSLMRISYAVFCLKKKTTRCTAQQ